MNVIVYVSDALRPDHLGCYGARSVSTPTLDEFAASGARFEQTVSAAPWTAPSMTSIITGLYPHRHGYLHWDVRLDPGIRTLFQAFGELGYERATFVFDQSYLFKGLAEANVLGTSERLDGAFGWLEENCTNPFLLFIHSWTTHMPYDVHHADRERWRAEKQKLLRAISEDDIAEVEVWRDAYRRAAEFQSETHFASLLGELDRLGLRDETAVAFLSDHGESWGERFEDKQEVKGIYHLHGATLRDEILLVPMILSAPGRVQPQVVGSQVRTVDLMPTLLELVGGYPDDIDGTSLMPVVSGSEQADRLALAATTDRGVLSQLALRSPPWKLIHHLETEGEVAYRIDVDPDETTNRFDEAPPELRAQLNLEAASIERQELSAEEEAVVTGRLADLGYL